MDPPAAPSPEGIVPPHPEPRAAWAGAGGGCRGPGLSTPYSSLSSPGPVCGWTGEGWAPEPGWGHRSFNAPDTCWLRGPIPAFLHAPSLRRRPVPPIMSGPCSLALGPWGPSDKQGMEWSPASPSRAAAKTPEGLCCVDPRTSRGQPLRDLRRVAPPPLDLPEWDRPRAAPLWGRG